MNILTYPKRNTHTHTHTHQNNNLFSHEYFNIPTKEHTHTYTHTFSHDFNISTKEHTHTHACRHLFSHEYFNIPTKEDKQTNKQTHTHTAIKKKDIISLITFDTVILYIIIIYIHKPRPEPTLTSQKVWMNQRPLLHFHLKSPSIAGSQLPISQATLLIRLS